MALDSFGNPAEQAASGRMSSLLNRVFAAGVAPQPQPGDTDGNDVLALMAAKELKAMKKSDAGQKLASQVQSYFSRVKSARLPFEREWLKNLDMAQGRQFTEWSATQKKMVTIPKPDYEPRVVVNVIEPAMRTALSQTGATHPNATVLPSSNDDSDQMAAAAAEMLWDWYYATEHFQTDVFNPGNWWAAHTGNGFIKTYFDDACKDPAATAAAQNVQDQSDSVLSQAVPSPLAAAFSDPAAGPTAPTAPVPPVLGKIRSRSVSPFHLYFPDLTATSIQDQPYIIHAYPINKQQARTVYKDFVDKDWNPTAQSADTIISAYQLGLPGGNTAMPETVIVVECWIKPGINENIPKGGVVVMIQGEIVGMSDGWPYDHEEFPFAHITGIETGTFYRRSVIGTMIPLQNELNRTYAQIVKHRNIALKPMMFYDSGSLDPKKIISKAGTYIPIALGANRPTAVPLQDLSQAFWNLIDKIEAELQNITGQHDVTQASAPGADTAASAIAQLQEADNNFLSGWLQSIERVFEQTARHFLALAVQFWDQPRLVKLAGDDMSYDVQELMGSDLKHGTDIRMEPGTGLPDSKAARIALITDWMKNGFIPVDVGMDALEMGTLGRLYRVIKVDQDQAIRENMDMKSLDVNDVQGQLAERDTPMAPELGAPQAPTDPTDLFSQINEPDLQQQAPDPTDPTALGGADPTQGLGAADAMAPAAPPALVYPINSFDNDAVHISMHERHMKSQAYKDYPDEIKQVFEEHRQAHLDRVGQLAAQQAQQASLAGAAQIKQENTPPGAPSDTMPQQGAEPGALQ